MFTALLDTCVLWPSVQRDFLLSMAAEGLYRPIWSQAILGELVHAETAKRVTRGADEGQARGAAERLVAQMEWAFDDASVTGWQPLVGSYGLPDPDDEHVVAAAVIGGAGVIVSDNLRDLPARLLPDGLQAVTAAQFAADTVTVSPATARTAVERMSARYRNPPQSTDELLDVLRRRYGLHQAVEMIRRT